MSKISRRSLASYSADQLIAGASARSVAHQLAATLIDSGMANQLDFLLGDIAWELERRGQLAVGHITTIEPLTKELEAALKSQIKRAAGTNEVLLENHIDKSVVGGLRVETSSRVWDNTLARKLIQLREVF